MIFQVNWLNKNQERRTVLPLVSKRPATTFQSLNWITKEPFSRFPISNLESRNISIDIISCYFPSILREIWKLKGWNKIFYLFSFLSSFRNIYWKSQRKWTKIFYSRERHSNRSGMHLILKFLDSSPFLLRRSLSTKDIFLSFYSSRSIFSTNTSYSLRDNEIWLLVIVILNK